MSLETYMNKYQIYFYADDTIFFYVTDSVWSAFGLLTILN